MWSQIAPAFRITLAHNPDGLVYRTVVLGRRSSVFPPGARSARDRPRQGSSAPGIQL